MTKKNDNIQPLKIAPDVGLSGTPDVPLAQTEFPKTTESETAGSETASVDSPVDEAPKGVEAVVQGKQSGKSLTTTIDVALDTFVAWASSDVVQEDLTAFVSMDLLTEDHALTDKGCEFLDAMAVPYRYINFLELGTPVTFLVEGQKYTIEMGSRMRVLSNSSDRDGSAYSICDAGAFLPNAQIYKNSHHVYLTLRYPTLQPLATEYKTGA